MKLIAYDTSTMQPLFLNLGVPLVRYNYLQPFMSFFEIQKLYSIENHVFIFIHCSKNVSQNTYTTAGDFDKGMYLTKEWVPSNPEMPDFSFVCKLFLVSLEYFLLRR